MQWAWVLAAAGLATAGKPSSVAQVAEEEWRDILKGEWMIEL